MPAKLVRIAALIGSLALAVLQWLAGALIGVFSGNVAASLFGPVIVAMLFMNLFATLILYLAAWLATSPETADTPEPEPNFAPPKVSESESSIAVTYTLAGAPASEPWYRMKSSAGTKYP